jgi:hypothetical protein
MITRSFIFAAILASLAAAPALAQQAPPTYIDTSCGTWQDDSWTPNGSCPNDTHKHARVAGTITSVKGHLVTVQQTGGTLVINDMPALNNQLTGKVAVGRQIVAHGYWDAGNFYATLIVTSDG